MQEFNETIYKKDSKGKIRFLNVFSEQGELVQISGVVGTDNPVEHRSACKAKNVGRANETTPEQQAVLEAQSKIETKMSKGYFKTKEEAEGERVILPMLAKTYQKEKKKVTFPCYVQPKLDGMRCLVIIKDGNISLMSRTGKEISTMGHIEHDLIGLYAENMVLDGELYAHGKTFQENMRLIKKYRPGKSEQIHFRCYDIVDPDLNFGERDEIIGKLLETSDCDYFSGVSTLPVMDEEQIKLYHEQFVGEGYEGTMVRWGNEGYKIAGRSSNLLKYKDFQDIACKVIDVEPSDKNPEQGVLVCENEAGRFGCGMKFSHQERREILKNKYDYIGRTAEIRFFEYTDDGLPRFPVCVGFREDK